MTLNSARPALHSSANQQRSGPTSKTPGECKRVLDLLRQRGPIGASNLGLVEIALRHGSRLHDLHRVGCRIETKSEGEGILRFVLLEEPARRKPLPTYDSRRRHEPERRDGLNSPFSASVSLWGHSRVAQD